MFKVQKRRCSIKEAVPRNFAIFTEKHLCWSHFNKVAGLRACNVIDNRLQYKCFPVDLAKFLRDKILEIICERLLLKVKLNLAKVCKSSRVWLKFIGKFFFQSSRSCLNGCFWKCNTFKHSSNEVASLKIYKKVIFLSDYFRDSNE